MQPTKRVAVPLADKARHIHNSGRFIYINEQVVRYVPDLVELSINKTYHVTSDVLQVIELSSIVNAYNNGARYLEIPVSPNSPESVQTKQMDTIMRSLQQWLLLLPLLIKMIQSVIQPTE